MNKGVFSDDFTSVFGDKLADIFTDGFPSHAGDFPNPVIVVSAPDFGGAPGGTGHSPFDLFADSFDFEISTDLRATAPDVGGGASLIEGDVSPMSIGKPGGDGGGGGGSGGGGGKPKDPPAETTVSESDPNQFYADTGGLPELGAGDDSFYFSSGGSERIGDTISNVAGFDIALEFLGDWSTAQAQIWMTALENTADFFTSFITEGLYVPTDVGGVAKADGLINDGTQYWDDLWIQISFEDIATDGVLASAGPTQFWGSAAGTTSGYMPAAGSMTVDSVYAMNAQSATLIATHEMMHVLGFGTIWGQSSVFAPWNHDLFNRKGAYTGTSANSAYESEFSADGGKMPALAAENGGGSGTAGGHWETDLAVHANTITADPVGDLTADDFAFELMTGWIDLSNADAVYLSDTSLAVLEDLGYVVDWNVDYAYDSYEFGYGVA